MSLNHTATLLAKRIAQHVPSLGPTLTYIGESPLFSRNRTLKSVPWRDVPVIINSFNRRDCLEKLVKWLVDAGHQNITIIDNASSYRPLLDYLSSLEKEGKVRVLHLGGNFGHKALWECNILTRLGINTEFVYTDPDIVPASFCPRDLVRALQAILREDQSISKAGPGLRIDDIPDHYRFKQDAIAWEQQYWLCPAARGAFFASIDTTFALYRPHSDHELRGNAIRLGWPYLASHEGWFVNHEAPTEEDRHYFDSTKASITTWATRSRSRDAPQYRERAELSKSKMTLLNIGCGNDIIPGYLNLDNSPSPRLDIRFDLDACATSPIPLSDDSVDGFYACHVIEHVKNTLSLMQELHRIAKPNAKMVIRVPYGSANDSMEDPTHIRPYYEDSFSYFAQPAYSRADYGYRGDWEVESVVLVVNRMFERFPEWITRQAVRKLRNVVQEMIVHLRAVKPMRPRRYELHRLTSPEFIFTRFDLRAGFANLHSLSTITEPRSGEITQN